MSPRAAWSTLACALAARLAAGQLQVAQNYEPAAGVSSDFWKEISDTLSEEAIKEDCMAVAQANVSGEQPYGPEKRISNSGCHLFLRANCTLSYSALSCPEACPYFSELVPCYFSCTTRMNCSQQNPDMAWPYDDNKTGRVCRACNVPMCKVCNSFSTCEVCHDSFKLSEDGGRCYLEASDAAWLHALLCIAAIFVGCLFLCAWIYPCIHGKHERAEAHQVSIRRARRHRHLCKTAQWSLEETDSKVRSVYSLGVNVHTRDIVGVGLPLWYNSICFLMVISVFALFGVYVVHMLDSTALEKRASSLINEKNTYLVPVTGSAPLALASPLLSCAKGSSLEEYQDALEHHDIEMVACVTILYLGVFALSVWFAGYQKRYERWFDKENTSMADFALRVRGLPPDETDEAEVRRELERMFREQLPGKFPRPQQHLFARSHDQEDTVKEVPDSQIEVQSVSIAYDFFERRGEVDDAVWKMMEVLDVTMFQRAGNFSRNDELHQHLYHVRGDKGLHKLSMDDTSLAFQCDCDARQMTEVEAHSRIRSQVGGLFEGPNKLKGTGTAIVVFDYAADQERVAQLAEEKPTSFKWKDGSILQVDNIWSEPPSIVWWGIGLSRKRLWKRTLVTLVKILAMITFILLCINLPYYWFIQKPYMDMGYRVTGLLSTVYGVLIGNLNGLVFFAIYLMGEGIGFHKKDELFSFVCVTTVAFILILNAITFMLVSKVAQANDTSGITYDEAFITAVCDMLPGMTFVGLIMKAVNPTAQYVWNQFLQKVIFVWRSFPDPILKVLLAILPWNSGSIERYPFRNAEKLADPWEIPVMGDYADFVAVPTTCFFMLSFATDSDSAWRIFGLMFGWTMFMYFYLRFTHLRFHRVNFYTTSTLNSVGMLLWGIPLSVIALQIPFWVKRSYAPVPWIHGPPLLMPECIATFFLSLGAWMFCFTQIVRPFDVQDEAENNDATVVETKMKKVYDWLNCNPVYALKCRYFFQDAEGRDIPERRKDHPIACGQNPTRVVYFEVGKEYLFVRASRQFMVGVHVANFLEPEFWTDLMVDRVHWLTNILPKKVKAAESREMKYNRFADSGASSDSSSPSSNEE